MKNILTIFMLLCFLTGFSQSDENYVLEVDSENGVNTVFIKNNLDGQIETVVTGYGVYDEIIQFYIETSKNLSFLAKSDSGLISYVWMKKKNNTWYIIEDQNFLTHISSLSSNQLTEIENGNKRIPIPLAYYIEDINKLTLVYTDKNGERSEEKYEFEDID